MAKQNPPAMFSAEILLSVPGQTTERKYMTSEVASQFGVSKKTILNWLKAQQIDVFRGARKKTPAIDPHPRRPGRTLVKNTKINERFTLQIRANAFDRFHCELLRGRMITRPE